MGLRHLSRSGQQRLQHEIHRPPCRAEYAERVLDGELVAEQSSMEGVYQWPELSKIVGTLS